MSRSSEFDMVKCNGYGPHSDFNHYFRIPWSIRICKPPCALNATFVFVDDPTCSCSWRTRVHHDGYNAANLLTTNLLKERTTWAETIHCNGQLWQDNSSVHNPLIQQKFSITESWLLPSTVCGNDSTVLGALGFERQPTRDNTHCRAAHGQQG